MTHRPLENIQKGWSWCISAEAPYTQI